MTRRALPFLLLALLASAAGGPAAAQYFPFGKNRVQYETPQWRFVRAPHVDVYYYERSARGAETGSGRLLALFAAHAAEQAYAEIAELLDYDLTRRVPILVYPSHRAFAVTNAADLGDYPEGIGGVTELFKNRVAVPFTGDWRQFRDVLHHELVHAVVNDAFRGGSVQSLLQQGARPVLPLWFNEGLAEYSALGWSPSADLWLRDAVLNGYLPPIGQLRGYLAYRGGQGVWDYVAEAYGPEKVTEILDYVRLSRSVEAGFVQATGLTTAQLSAQWHRALRAVYYPEAAAREDLAAATRPVATAGAAYHASPALAPLADRVAYIASSDGLFDVFVAPTNGAGAPARLLEGQTSREVESLRLTSPGLAWSPDGERLAVAVSSGPDEAVVLVNTVSGARRSLRLPGLDAVNALAWSPDGRWLALAATAGGQPDLFLYDLGAGRLARLTDDVLTAHAPAWAPDGRSLVFHSDRGDAPPLQAATLAGGGGGGPAALLARTGQPHRLYRLAVGPDGRAAAPPEPLPTGDHPGDDTRPAFASDSTLVFVSDRSGIPNLYSLDLRSGSVRARTDFAGGVLDASLAADGRTAALLVLDDGVPGVFLLRDPATRTDAPATPAPTVWAQRAARADPALPAAAQAPALRVAAEGQRRRNPFLRAAAEGRPARPGPAGLPDAAGIRPDVDLDSLLAALLGPTGTPPRALPDSLFLPGSLAFEPPRTPGRPLPGTPLPDGALRLYRYRLTFSPDLVYASGDFDTVYGVQTLTQLLFSDLLGNHRIAIGTNLVLDLRNADYQLRYAYLARRADVLLEGFHLARELPDFAGATVYRYRNFGLVTQARYPLDKFQRLDAEAALLGVSLADLGDLGARPRTRLFPAPRLTYTADYTRPGRAGPSGGGRYAVSLSGTPGPSVRFATLLADGRLYRALGSGASLAFRASAGLSAGPDPQRFFAAGVQTWIGASFESLPVDGPDDFVFATPVLPLRGFGYDEARGDRFVLLNGELRAPLAAALVPGPLPLAPLYDLRVVGFTDVGLIAQGRPVLVRDTADGGRVLDDLLLGLGLGLRAQVLGYPLRLDRAWAFDGARFGPARTYLSLGFDF
ncbi:MAG: peptidase S9 [Rubricoccaceae bacterium]